MITVRARLKKNDRSKVLCGYGGGTCSQVLAEVVDHGSEEGLEILVLPFAFTTNRDGIVRVSRLEENKRRAKESQQPRNRRPTNVLSEVTLEDDGKLTLTPAKGPIYHSLPDLGFSKLPIAVACPKHDRDVVNLLDAETLGLSDTGFRTP